MTSPDGASIELRPTRYQFADAGEPGSWDANWLDIHGRMRTAAGESWVFDDPCLTTWEARDLGDWLRAAAEGRLPSDLLTFTEPNLGFGVEAREDGFLAVRVHLSAEAAAGRACSIPIRVSRQDLLAAAGSWADDLTPFPGR